MIREFIILRHLHWSSNGILRSLVEAELCGFTPHIQYFNLFITSTESFATIHAGNIQYCIWRMKILLYNYWIYASDQKIHANLRVIGGGRLSLYFMIFHLIIEPQTQLFDEESQLYFWYHSGPEIQVKLPSRSFDLTGWRGMSGFHSQPAYSTVSPRKRAAKAALWRGNTILCAQTLGHGHKTLKSAGWEAHRVFW